MLLRNDFDGSNLADKYTENELCLLSKVFEVTRDAVIITDANAKIQLVNPTFCLITGYTQEEMVGNNPRILQSGKHDPNFYKFMWGSLENHGSWEGEIWNRRKNGDIYPEWLRIYALKDRSGKITHFIALFSDITDAKSSAERLQFLAFYDPLTRLPNRLLFQDRLEQAMSASKRFGYLVALLFIDLDRFKYINDTLGHSTGDFVLKTVASRISQNIGTEDTVSRRGGDEFIIILTNILKIEDVYYEAEKILNIISEPIMFEGNELYVTGSIGISLYPIDGNDMETLIRNADTAMYRAKELQNHFYIYTSEMNQIISKEAKIESALRKALDRNEFQVYYQPQIDIRTYKLIGLEVLIRWHNPELGNVSPCDFIPIAEETGLIVPIGEWVMRTACEQNKKWQDSGHPPIYVAVNLSVRQFRQANLRQTITQILQDTGLAPQYLKLEITESIALHNLPDMLSRLNQLKDMGLQLAIDDFGTGYSSLNYLKTYPIDTLKIDRSFICDLSINPDDMAIVSAIIAMAHGLKLHVIAEGVESEEELNYLKEFGCDAVQGFIFGRPTPVEEVEKIFSKY